jgi:hypothetical protein
VDRADFKRVRHACDSIVPRCAKAFYTDTRSAA